MSKNERRHNNVVALGGLRCRLHLRLLRLIAGTLRVRNGRGLGRVVDRLGFATGVSCSARAEVHPGRVMEAQLSDGYWMPVLLGRPYEPEIGLVLSSLLRPDSLFLDLGANFGFWSLFASTVIRDPRRIIAVEASPHTAASLQHNSLINGDCFTAVHAAIWNVGETIVEIATDPKRHAWTSADSRIIKQLDRFGFARVKVPTITIDDLCRPFAGHPVIKLDLEGAEPQALLGAARTLERGSTIIYERHERGVENDVTEILTAAGYSITQLFDKSHPTHNFLAVKST